MLAAYVHPSNNIKRFIGHDFEVVLLPVGFSALK